MVPGSLCEEVMLPGHSCCASTMPLPSRNAIAFSQKLPCMICNVKLCDTLNVCMLCQTLLTCDWRRLEFMSVFVLVGIFDCSITCLHFLHAISSSCLLVHRGYPVNSSNHRSFLCTCQAFSAACELYVCLTCISRVVMLLSSPKHVSKVHQVFPIFLYLGFRV